MRPSQLGVDGCGEETAEVLYDESGSSGLVVDDGAEAVSVGGESDVVAVEVAVLDDAGEVKFFVGPLIGGSHGVEGAVRKEPFVLPVEELWLQIPQSAESADHQSGEGL